MASTSMIGKESPRVGLKKVEKVVESSYLKAPLVGGLPEGLKKWGITPKEKEDIQKLRLKLGDLATARYTDVRLCRFLRAREHKLDLAEEMIRKEMKWRAEVNPERILAEFPNDPHFAKLTSYWPGDFHGVDRFGVPMLIERLGAIDTVALFNNANHDLLIKFHIYCMERNDAVFSAAWEQFGSPTGYVHIEDVDGLSMKHYSPQVIDTLKEISRIDDNYYPETLRKFIIVNAPVIFKVFWKMAKMILNKNTIAKFQVVKGSYEKELNEVATPDNIPQFLGGKCITCKHTSTACKHGGGKITANTI